MKKEIRSILEKFFLSVIVICCIGTFFAGTVTARERGQYNLKLEKYAVFSMKSDSRKIEMTVDGEKYIFDSEKYIDMKKLRNAVLYTPFSVVWLLFEKIME